MFVYGRGPMNRGFGPMGGPVHHHPMGFRPMSLWHRPMFFFPLGGLFILPALMFGGWIALAVLGGMLSLVGTVIGGIFSGSGLVLGIVIGLIAYSFLRGRRNAEDAED